MYVKVPNVKEKIAVWIARLGTTIIHSAPLPSSILFSQVSKHMQHMFTSMLLLIAAVLSPVN